MFPILPVSVAFLDARDLNARRRGPRNTRACLRVLGNNDLRSRVLRCENRHENRVTRTKNPRDPMPVHKLSFAARKFVLARNVRAGITYCVPCLCRPRLTRYYVRLARDRISLFRPEIRRFHPPPPPPPRSVIFTGDFCQRSSSCGRKSATTAHNNKIYIISYISLLLFVFVFSSRLLL